MQGLGGFLVLALAIIMLWLGLTNRTGRLTAAWNALTADYKPPKEIK